MEPPAGLKELLGKIIASVEEDGDMVVGERKLSPELIARHQRFSEEIEDLRDEAELFTRSMKRKTQRLRDDFWREIHQSFGDDPAVAEADSLEIDASKGVMRLHKEKKKGEQPQQPHIGFMGPGGHC